MLKQSILAAGLVLLACTVGGTTIKAGAAAAQAAPAEKAPVYTYVSEWTVPHARCGRITRKKTKLMWTP